EPETDGRLEVRRADRTGRHVPARDELTPDGVLLALAELRTGRLAPAERGLLVRAPRAAARGPLAVEQGRHLVLDVLRQGLARRRLAALLARPLRLAAFRRARGLRLRRLRLRPRLGPRRAGRQFGRVRARRLGHG